MRGSMIPCENCGEPVHAHDREKEFHDNGTWSYSYYCEDGSAYEKPEENQQGML